MRTTRKRAIVGLLGVVAAGVIAIGVSELPGGSTTDSGTASSLTAAQTRTLLVGSPPALEALHMQAGELLNDHGGALQARLKALKGYPVVINKWASWCEPCKAEFAAFQRVSAEYGRRVAFIGIDSGDNSRSDAMGFLRSHAVSYPSYYDQSGELGIEITDSSSTPVTLFIARDGRQFPRQGQYPSVKKLQEDVRHYALGS